jgi:hypothetical protein
MQTMESRFESSTLMSEFSVIDETASRLIPESSKIAEVKLTSEASGDRTVSMEPYVKFGQMEESTEIMKPMAVRETLLQKFESEKAAIDVPLSATQRHEAPAESKLPDVRKEIRGQQFVELSEEDIDVGNTMGRTIVYKQRKHSKEIQLPTTMLIREGMKMSASESALTFAEEEIAAKISADQAQKLSIEGVSEAAAFETRESTHEYSEIIPTITNKDENLAAEGQTREVRSDKIKAKVKGATEENVSLMSEIKIIDYDASINIKDHADHIELLQKSQASKDEMVTTSGSLRYAEKEELSKISKGEALKDSMERSLKIAGVGSTDEIRSKLTQDEAAKTSVSDRQLEKLARGGLKEFTEEGVDVGAYLTRTTAQRARAMGDELRISSTPTTTERLVATSAGEESLTSEAKISAQDSSQNVQFIRQQQNMDSENLRAKASGEQKINLTKDISSGKPVSDQIRGTLSESEAQRLSTRFPETQDEIFTAVIDLSTTDDHAYFGIADVPTLPVRHSARAATEELMQSGEVLDSKPEMGVHDVSISLKREESARRSFAVEKTASCDNISAQKMNKDASQVVVRDISRTSSIKKLREVSEERAGSENIYTRGILVKARKHSEEIKLPSKAGIKEQFRARASVESFESYDSAIASQSESMAAESIIVGRSNDQCELITYAPRHSFSETQISLSKIDSSPQQTTAGTLSQGNVAEDQMKLLESREESVNLMTRIEWAEDEVGIEKPVPAMETMSLQNLESKEFNTGQSTHLARSSDYQRAEISKPIVASVADTHNLAISTTLFAQEMCASKLPSPTPAELILDASRSTIPMFSDSIREYQQTTVDTTVSLHQLAPYRPPGDEKQLTLKTTRDWTEILDSKATYAEEQTHPLSISQHPAAEQTVRAFKAPNLISSSLQASASSHIQTPTYVADFSRTATDLQHSAVKIKDIPSAKEKSWLREQGNELNFFLYEAKLVETANEAKTVVKYLTSESTKVGTQAAQLSGVEFTQSLMRPEPIEGALHSRGLAEHETKTGEYRTGQTVMSKQFSKGSARSGAIKTVEVGYFAEPSNLKAYEFGEEKMDTSVVLEQIPVKKTMRSTTDHIVDIESNMQQQLATQSASETFVSKGIEYRESEPMYAAQNILASSIREQCELKGLSSKEEIVIFSHGIQKPADISQESEKRLISANKEARTETLKPSISSEIGVITHWQLVDRSLEAGAELDVRTNQFIRSSMIQSADEATNVTESWKNKEDRGEFLHEIRIKNIEVTSRDFRIAPEISAEKILTSTIALPEETQKTLEIPFIEQTLKKTTESGDEKLSIMIELHCIDAPKPQIAEQNIKYPQKISVTPMRLSADAENIVMSGAFKASPLTSGVELKRKSAVIGPSTEIKTEATIEDKVKLSVEMISPYEKPMEQTQKTLPIPNEEKDHNLDVEEFLEDEVLMYAYLTTKDIKFSDTGAKQYIPNNYELLPPLSTKASTLEIPPTTSVQWEIAQKHELTQLIRPTAANGGKFDKRTREATDETQQITYVYNKEPENTEVPPKVIEYPRPGGQYLLEAKAASDEERLVTLSLCNSLQSEVVRRKLPYKAKVESSSMRLLESTQENQNVGYHFSQPSHMEEVECSNKCAFEGQPITEKLRESTNIFERVNYELRHEKPTTLTGETIRYIAGWGGSDKLDTDASEFNEVFPVRELKRDEDRFEQSTVLICSNVEEPQSLRTHESVEEQMQRVDAYSRSSQYEKTGRSFSDYNRTESPNLKTRESTSFSESINLNYMKPVDSVEPRSLIRFVPLDGGKYNFNCGHTQEDNVACIRSLVSLQHQVLHASKTFIEHRRPDLPPAPLHTKAFEEVPKQMQFQLQRPEAYQRCTQTLRTGHKETESFVVSESLEESHRVSCEYTRPNDYHFSERIVMIPATGSPALLDLLATQEALSNQVFTLVKKRDASPAPTRRCVICSREMPPIDFRVRESTANNSFISETLRRDSEHALINFLLKWANEIGPEQLKCKETGSVTEVTNVQYNRPLSSATSLTTVFEAMFGGKFDLELKSSSEEKTDLAESIQKRRPYSDLMNADTTKFITRTGEPVQLRSVAVQTEDISLHEHLQSKEAHTATVETTSFCANTIEPSKHRVQESESQSFDFAWAFNREPDFAPPAATIVNIPFNGGTFALSGKRSGDAEVTLHRDLDAGAIVEGQTDVTREISRSPVGLLSPYHTKATFDFAVCVDEILSCTNIHDMVAPPLTLALTRDSPFAPSLHTNSFVFLHEHVSCSMERPVANLAVTVTLIDARFGGRVELATSATYQSEVVTTQSLQNRLQLGSIEIETRIVIPREEAPISLDTPASDEAMMVTSTQLQRAEQRMQAPPHKITTDRRFENPPSVRVTETKEIELLNNVSLKRPEQFEYSPDHVCNEHRFGGSFSHSTSGAIESQTDANLPPLNRPESNAEAPLHKITIANDASESLMISSAGDESTLVSREFEQTLIDTEQTDKTIFIAREENAIFQAKETISEGMTTTVAFQSPTAGSSMGQETTVPLQRFGGSISMICNASGKTDTDENVINISRPSPEVAAPPKVIWIARTYEMERLELSSQYAEEAHFSIDAKFTREPADSLVELTQIVARPAPSAPLLSSGTSAVREVEIIAVVRRQIEAESLAETTFAIAREFPPPPIMLCAEYAKERFTEAELMVSAGETTFTERIEETVSTIERVNTGEFTCDAGAINIIV